MLLETRKLLAHPRQELEGSVEFHDMGDRVEARFLKESGRADCSADACHALLRCYQNAGGVTLYFSQNRVKNGVVCFSDKARFEDWKTPLPKGLQRIIALQDSDLLYLKEHPRDFPLPIEWLTEIEWSGQAIFKE